jgi:hypothetical protein
VVEARIEPSTFQPVVQRFTDFYPAQWSQNSHRIAVYMNKGKTNPTSTERCGQLHSSPQLTFCSTSMLWSSYDRTWFTGPDKHEIFILVLTCVHVYPCIQQFHSCLGLHPNNLQRHAADSGSAMASHGTQDSS